MSDWNAAIQAARKAQPCTAENPNENDYQRGRFDGIIEYAKAISALKRPAPLDGGWRPIESAPKDGTHVLIADEICVSEARYIERSEGWWIANTDPTDAHDGQFHNPTHWMPKPDGPKQ